MRTRPGRRAGAWGAEPSWSPGRRATQPPTRRFRRCPWGRSVARPHRRWPISGRPVGSGPSHRTPARRRRGRAAPAPLREWGDGAGPDLEAAPAEAPRGAPVAKPGRCPGACRDRSPHGRGDAVARRLPGSREVSLRDRTPCSSTPHPGLVRLRRPARIRSRPDVARRALRAYEARASGCSWREDTAGRHDPVGRFGRVRHQRTIQAQDHAARPGLHRSTNVAWPPRGPGDPRPADRTALGTGARSTLSLRLRVGGAVADARLVLARRAAGLPHGDRQGGRAASPPSTRGRKPASLDYRVPEGRPLASPPLSATVTPSAAVPRVSDHVGT